MLLTLTTGGWILMIVSITAVTALTIGCYKHILGNPKEDEPDLPPGLGP